MSDVQFGLTLSSEEHDPARLVAMAGMAEEAGLDFVSISDHFHPWLDEQGHSPFVWTVLGAIAQATERIGVGVGVTCPIVRIHPAILAQATATTAHLLGERFTWGVGTGEALNEHILGDVWPAADLRIEMLAEAIELIRELWKGEWVTHRGTHFTVEKARIYDPPPVDVPILVSAFGPMAARMAGEHGDGLWQTSAPDEEAVENWRKAGGEGPIWTQLDLCWAEAKDEAVETAHRIWRKTGVPGQLNQDLPTPMHFEEAASIVSKEMVADSMPCGPDPEPVLEEARAAIEAGATHVYFHQIGPDQEGFLKFWREELAAKLT